MNLAEIREQFVDVNFDVTTFTVDQQKMLDWANACGETDPRFIDPDHEDFQAQPTFTAQYSSSRMLPDDFPQIGDGRGVDGGKSIEKYAPVRPGDTLTGKAQIHDVYDKTGRSGTMVFIVHRMIFENQNGEHVSTVDWRMIRPIEN
ncbi:MAG: MaoC family dehydratase [Actinomycetia bacterium]|nr:MaoC family dehydratase [Actinomycetes bacterium]